MVAIEKLEEGVQLPPAYTDSEYTAPEALPPDHTPFPSSSSSFQTPTPPLSPPTNFLTIVRDHQAVKGGYTIDPSMRVPPGAVLSDGDDGKPLNMRVESNYGSVDVVVELVRGGDVKGPARLEVGSRYGSVTVAVHNKGMNRFRLKATSKYGAVVVRLPSTFVGPVSTWLKYGKLTFSPTIQARLATISEQNKEGRFFIGDNVSSGYEDDESWSGDHLRIEAEYGRVKIEVVREGSEALAPGQGSSRKKGLFRRLLS